MNDDQVDKAISFLLDSQASLSAKLDALAVNVAANTKAIADLTTDVKALTDLANGSRDIANQTAKNVLQLVEAQKRTDAQLNRLASLFVAHISDSHGGGPTA